MDVVWIKNDVKGVWGEGLLGVLRGMLLAEIFVLCSLLLVYCSLFVVAGLHIYGCHVDVMVWRLRRGLVFLWVIGYCSRNGMRRYLVNRSF